MTLCQSVTRRHNAPLRKHWPQRLSCPTFFSAKPEECRPIEKFIWGRKLLGHDYQEV